MDIESNHVARGAVVAAAKVHCLTRRGTAAFAGTHWRSLTFSRELQPYATEEKIVARGLLLWLLGVPIPIIILILLFWH